MTPAAKDTDNKGLSQKEKEAVKARAAELKEESRNARSSAKAEKEAAAVDDKIAEMTPADRKLAKAVHKVVLENAPELAPKLWYSQPAYAKDGKVICFFRSGDVDGERYSTFGFSASANLDDDTGVWATSFALTELTAKGEALLAKLIKQAVK
jgi:uncharacterized protein YdhG (YjbR/CyaY superfamily)